MRFYNKIFIAFFGLLLITTRIAIGADTQICPPDSYISNCDLHHPDWPPETNERFKGAEINPENIFFATAFASGAMTGGTSAFLCWDLNDPKNNYDNLRKLMNPTETEEPLSCFILSGTAAPDEKLTYVVNYIYNSIASVTSNIMLIPTDIQKDVYAPAGNTVKELCDPNSIPEDDATDKPSYCKACPYNGHSKGAYHNGTAWTEFSTIADCSKWTGEEGGHKTYDDATGTFYYSNDGVCHYSGK